MTTTSKPINQHQAQALKHALGLALYDISVLNQLDEHYLPRCKKLAHAALSSVGERHIMEATKQKKPQLRTVLSYLLSTVEVIDSLEQEHSYLPSKVFDFRDEIKTYLEGFGFTFNVPEQLGLFEKGDK